MKFGIFKGLIKQALLDKEECLRLTKEEARLIVEYGVNSYFRHLRLYEFVLNNKTASEMKRVNFTQEQARKPAPLDRAL